MTIPLGGYLHDENDDSPYDVDGVFYCGRCHHVVHPQTKRCEAVRPLPSSERAVSEDPTCPR